MLVILGARVISVIGLFSNALSLILVIALSASNVNLVIPLFIKAPSFMPVTVTPFTSLGIVSSPICVTLLLKPAITVPSNIMSLILDIVLISSFVI